jgi:hypothetical protein
MSSLIKANTPRAPAVPPPITATSPEVLEAAEAERKKKKGGYASTVLTGQEGVTEEARVGRKTLGT